MYVRLWAMEPLESSRFIPRSGLTDGSGHIQLFTWALRSLKTSSSQAQPPPQPGFTSSHRILWKARSIQQFAWLRMLSSIQFKLKHNALGLQTDKLKNSKGFPKFKVSLGFYAGSSAQLTSLALSCSCGRCQRRQCPMEKMWRAAGAAVPRRLRPMIRGKKKNTLVM